MDHRKSGATPCVKTGAQVVLSRVLVKRDILDQAHRLGLLLISSYKKLVKTNELEDINGRPSRTLDVSREENVFSTSLKYSNDNFKENEVPVRSDSFSRKRKRENVDSSFSSPLSLPLRAHREGQMKRSTIQKAQSVSREVRRPVQLSVDSTKRNRNVDEGPHSSLNVSDVSSTSNCSNVSTQKQDEMGGSFEGQRMVTAERGEALKQDENPPPLLVKGSESDCITPVKVSPGESSTVSTEKKQTEKKQQCISSCEVTGNEIPITEDVQITSQTVVEGICSETKVNVQNDSRTDGEESLSSVNEEESLTCEPSQMEDIQVSKASKIFTQSLSDDIYDKLQQDFVGETCERGKSWKSMDGIHNSDKENDARVWEEKMNSETFQRLLKNAVLESVFQSPEAQEQRNTLEKYQEKLALLEIENRRLQDFITNLKSLMGDLEKGIDSKYNRGTQVNMDVDLKRISDPRKDGNVASVAEVPSAGTVPNSSAAASSVSPPESAEPRGTSSVCVDYLHKLVSSSLQTDDSTGGQCGDPEVPENCTDAVKPRVSGKSPEPTANGSGLVAVKKEPQDLTECDNSASIQCSFPTTVQSFPIGHFASITNPAYPPSATASTGPSSTAPPLSTVPLVQRSQYPPAPVLVGAQEYPYTQSSLVQSTPHQQNQPHLPVQTQTASTDGQLRMDPMQMHLSFLAQRQHLYQQHHQQFLQQRQQQYFLQRQQQLRFQQPVGQRYFHPGALLAPASSYENGASLNTPRMMNVQARPPSAPRLQTPVNLAVYNQGQSQPLPIRPFGPNIDPASNRPPNRTAPMAGSFNTSNRLHQHKVPYGELSVERQRLVQQELRLRRQRASEYQRYKEEQTRIQQQSAQVKNKATARFFQPNVSAPSPNTFSTAQNNVTGNTADEIVCVSDGNAAAGQDPNPTEAGRTYSAVPSLRKSSVESDGRGNNPSSQAASSKILVLTPPTTPSSPSPPIIVDDQGSDTSPAATTDVISSSKRSLETPPMPGVDKIPTSVRAPSNQVLEAVASSYTKPPESQFTTQGGELNLPPQPSASVAFVQGNVVLSWNMTKMPLTPIAKYQLYSYLVEDLTGDTTNPWRNIGTMTATPLPMACKLTEFEVGTTYCFAVSAVDIYGRAGPLSNPSKVTVTKDD